MGGTWHARAAGLHDAANSKVVRLGCRIGQPDIGRERRAIDGKYDEVGVVRGARFARDLRTALQVGTRDGNPDRESCAGCFYLDDAVGVIRRDRDARQAKGLQRRFESFRDLGKRVSGQYLVDGRLVVHRESPHVASTRCASKLDVGSIVFRRKPRAALVDGVGQSGGDKVECLVIYLARVAELGSVQIERPDRAAVLPCTGRGNLGYIPGKRTAGGHLGKAVARSGNRRGPGGIAGYLESNADETACGRQDREFAAAAGDGQAIMAGDRLPQLIGDVLDRECRGGADIRRADTVEPGLAIDDEGPGLSLCSRAAEGDDGDGIWRTEAVKEGRAGDGDFISTRCGLERAVDIAVDLGDEARGYIGGCHTEEVVDGIRLNRGRDPRVVRAFEGGVIHRLDFDLSRCRPVGAGKGNRVAANSRAAGRVECDLAVKGKIDLDVPGGGLGERDPIAVGPQPAGRSQVGASALGHDWLIHIRERTVFVVGRDQHGRCIVVDHRCHQSEDSEAVIGTAVFRTRPLLGTMHDIETAGTLRQQILLGVDIDRLRVKPVVAGEGQGHPVQVRCAGGCSRTELDAPAPCLLHAFAQRYRNGGHGDALFRCAGEHHLVAIDHQVAAVAVFEDADRTNVEHDDDVAFVVVAHIHRDVLDEDVLVGRVVRGRGLNDEAAVALELVADDRDRLAAATADVEGIAAKATDDLERNACAGALDEEAVVAFDGIDHDLLEARIGDEEAGAVDTLVVHNEVVAELGADHRQRVEAVAAVDAHRCVNGEGDEVRALAAVDVRVGRFRVVRIDLDEGPHRKGIVVLVAEQEELGLVAVHREVVVAAAAEQHGALADAVGEEAAGDLGGFEIILLCEAVVRIAVVAEGLVDLTDLEGIAAGIAEDSRRRQIVIEDEDIVTVATEDLDRTADVGVVVDALDDATRHRQAVRIDLDRCDHAYSGSLVGPQKEVVDFVGAIDAQAVDAVIARRLVEHVDARRDLPGEPDLVTVATLLAMQGELSVDAADEGLLALVVVIDADDVVAPAAVDRGRTGDAVDVDDVVGAIQDRLLVAEVEEGDTGVRRLDVEAVVVIAEPDLEQVESGVADAELHAQPDKLNGGKATILALGIAGVIDLQRIGRSVAGIKIEPALDRVGVGVEGVEHAGQLADTADGAADPHRIAAAACGKREVAGHGFDVEDVRAVAAAEDGDRAVAMGAFDGEYVAVRRRIAKMDVQAFQCRVGDAAVGAHQAQAGRAADHAVGDAGSGERTVIRRAVARIVQHEQIPVASALTVHRQQGVDVVNGSACVCVRLTEAAQRRVAAEVDRITAAAGVQHGTDVDCPDRQPVVTAARVDLEVLDTRSGDLHSVRQVLPAVRNVQRLEGRDAIGGEQVAVCRIGSRQYQTVAAIGAGGSDVHDGRTLGRHRDEIVLGIGSVVGSIVKISCPAPVEGGNCPAAGHDRAIEVVHHEGVVATGAGDPSHLEQVLQVFDDGVPGPAVAGVDQFVCGILVGFETSGAGTVEQVADDQPVVVEADIGAEGLGTRSQILDQGVNFVLVGLIDASVTIVIHAVAGAGAGIEEFVKAQVAGIGVAAQSAIEDVVEARTLEDVVAGAGDDRQRSSVGLERAGIDGVVAATCRNDELVALGPETVGHDDLRRSGGEAGADAGVALVCTVGVGQRHDIDVAIVAEDGDGVSCTII